MRSWQLHKAQGMRSCRHSMHQASLHAADAGTQRLLPTKGLTSMVMHREGALVDVGIGGGVLLLNENLRRAAIAERIFSS